MKSYFLLIIFSLFLAPAYGQYTEKFSDYFASSEDYALRKLIKNMEGQTDTLLGQCIDSIFTGNVEAIHDLANQVITISPENPLGFVFRSVARADLDSLTLAFEDINKALELEPELMLAYTTKARFFLSEEQPNKARNTLKIASERLPDRPEPVFLLGAVDWRTSHKIRARKNWEISVSRDSCYTPARVAILGQRYVMGRLGKGIEELESLLECEDVSPDILHLLAAAESTRGHKDKALDYINDALDLYPDEAKYLSLRSNLYYEQEMYELAVEDLYFVYGSYSTPKRKQRFSFSRFNRKTRMEEALNYYMQYQSGYPDDFRALLARHLMELDKNDNIALRKSTKALLKSKYGKEACALYFAVLAEIHYGTEERMLELTTAALNASPDIPDLYRLRGNRFMAKKDYRSAYTDYSKLMTQRPSSVKPLQGMAKILEATNRVKPAINMYDKVLAIDSTDLEALTRLGEIYFGQQNFPMAVTYYDLYLDEIKDRATIRHHRATCRYILGDIEGASEDLRELSDFYGNNNLESQNLRGVVLTEQDSLESALAVFNAIFFKDNDFQNAYFNRGRVYLKMGEWTKAVADFDKTIASDPKNAFAYYERSVAKAKLKIESACADLDKAITLGHSVTEEDRLGICPP